MKKLMIFLQKVSVLIFCLMLVGCIDDNQTSQNAEINEEIPTLEVMVFGSASSEARERISTELSKITREKIGCDVDIRFFNFSVYQQELRKKQLEEDSPDVLCVFEQDMLSILVNNEELLALNYYVQEYEEDFSKYLSETDWASMSLQKNIYAVPTAMNGEYALGAFMRDDILKQLNIDPTQIKTLEDFEMVLKRVRDETKLIPLVAHFSDITAPLGEDPLGNGLGVLLDVSKKDTTVENFYASQKYYKFTKRMHEWYEQELIMNNAVLNKEASIDLISNDIGFAYLHRYKAGVIKSSQQRSEYDLTVARLSDFYLTTDTNNLGWGISSDTKYPNESMALIHLLYTNSEAMDLCAYGMEGYEYQRISEDVITKIDASVKNQWATIGWTWPNLRISSAYQTDSGKVIDFENNNEPVHVSPAYGFVFDSSMVQTEIENCKAVINKYHKPLVVGMLDPDETIPLFVNELKAAGIEGIIEEKQKQLNEFISKN